MNSNSKKGKILITGANGQIGQVLTQRLKNKYGQDRILSTDITKPQNPDIILHETFEFLDILNKARLKEIIGDYGITEIYHLAAILSANGEWNPKKTWNVNLNGLLTVLSLAEEMKINKVFFPSTIAVFGKTTPRTNTPQHCPLLPETVYGMTKATGENWCHYFHKRYGLDVRSIRYPGILGHRSLPGGGTTDYAVEIFYAALRGENYKCYISENTRLPMMYMEDALHATIMLMEAPPENITIRTGYNLAAVSFTPKEIATEIKKHIPGFEIVYEPDFRQKIAESWSESIDDTYARRDWGWNHQYDLPRIVADMLHHLKNKI